MKKISVIAFDADDTLWVNEPYYQETEKLFCAMMHEYATPERVSEVLLQTEKQNIALYGFGAKGFTLSMIETAMHVSDGKAGGNIVSGIISLGKALLDKPVELLGDVRTVLSDLHSRYTMVIATKGDLLDQQRKLSKSGIEKMFHHIEIMSDKAEADYQKLLMKLNARPEEFLMIGNSMKSDVLPVVAIGGTAIHIPYSVTWQHEAETEPVSHPKILTAKRMGEILAMLEN